jgi:hypothetical protein
MQGARNTETGVYSCTRGFQDFAATQQMGEFVSFAPLRAVQTLNNKIIERKIYVGIYRKTKSPEIVQTRTP